MTETPRTCGGCDQRIDNHAAGCLFEQCEHGASRFHCKACNDAARKRREQELELQLERMRRTCAWCQQTDQCAPTCSVQSRNALCRHGMRELGCHECNALKYRRTRRRVLLVIGSSLSITGAVTFAVATIASPLATCFAAVLAQALGEMFCSWALGVGATMHQRD